METLTKENGAAGARKSSRACRRTSVIIEPHAAPNRPLGLAIGVGGMLLGTPDAMALRFQEQYGGTDETIGFWRFIVSAALTLVFGIVTAGGVSKLFSTLASSACGLAVASALGICTQSGFYYSLMLLDPAKAFLFISLSLSGLPFRASCSWTTTYPNEPS